MTVKSEGPAIPADYRDRLAETWQTLIGIAQASTSLAVSPPSRHGSVPLTLLSGFLGAGKTTLLNYLLSEAHGFKVAVLVNDFGSINVDTSLIRDRNAKSISLTNGCVCCTLSGGLTQTLAEIVSQDLPDFIVLEASGIAEPNGVVQIALSNPAVQLNGVVVVVDVESLQTHLGEPVLATTIERQVVAADLVLLNKCDLAGTRAVRAAAAWVAQKTSTARILETRYARVPTDVVLGPGSPHSRLVADDPDRGHLEGYTSVTLVAKGLLNEDAVCRFAATLPSGVLRAKGILRFENGDRAVLQVVGKRWSLQEVAEPEHPRLTSELLVIGLTGTFERDALLSSFNSCVRQRSI